MSALMRPAWPSAPLEACAPARLALLGTGNVGAAVVARLAQWSGTPLGERLRLVHVANSRQAAARAHGIAPCDVLRSLRHAPQADGPAAIVAALDGEGARIVIDATASDAVAGCHAAWLARGIHVVTACKLGQGASLQRWREIHDACMRGDTCYGDSATVGAGLPLLRSLRELQAGGDRIHAIAGVLSGSLAWLFHRYDGTQPFSQCVRAARAAGYTEPDPRDDLSGADVRRKLLILARAAGVPLEADEVEVASLVPAAMAALPAHAIDAALPMLDAPMREQLAATQRAAGNLRFVARLEDLHGSAAGPRGRGQRRARVGLEALAPDHPLAGGAGTDNRVAIWSDRYCDQPLVIQGAGAGAAVTAASLLDDVLGIARRSAPRCAIMGGATPR